MTEKEKGVQGLCADLFKIPSEQIGANDNFFHLGGDSIIDMRLAMSARRQGLRLPVPYIFDHPGLPDLATLLGDLSSNDPTSEYRPGSLLGITDLEPFATRILPESSLPFETSNVIEILPTIEVQSQLLEVKKMSPTAFSIYPRALIRSELKLLAGLLFASMLSFVLCSFLMSAIFFRWYCEPWTLKCRDFVVMRT